MKPLRKLVQHCGWANECWIGFIAEASESDEYVVKRISHILLGEQAWFLRIAGEQPDRDIWRALTVQELREMQRTHESTYARVLDGDLGRVISYQRFTGEQYRSAISDIVLHLVTHGAHHQGQVAAHVASMGQRAPNTDFVQFCIMNGW